MATISTHTEPTLPEVPTAQPTTPYTLHLPAFHPPYENPIDGRFPFHFDDSSEMKDYYNAQGENVSFSFTREFGEKWHSLMDEKFNPPLDACLEVRTCVTAAAKSVVQETEKAPEESPPFFAVTVGEIAGRDMQEVLRTLKVFLEGEFGKEEWPELWDNGGVVIRFFGAIATDELF